MSESPVGITWELWLACDIVTDKPLPWQKSQAILTPGRVAQAMGGVLALIGTPAVPPKPRGKSPGWQTGEPRLRRTRYPVVKKGTARVPSAVPNWLKFLFISPVTQLSSTCE